MPAGPHDMAAGGPEVRHPIVAARKDPAVEQAIAPASAGKARGIERDEIGEPSKLDRAGVAPQRLRAARKRGIVKEPPRRAVPPGQNDTNPVTQALGIFELTQFLRDADADV